MSWSNVSRWVAACVGFSSLIGLYGCVCECPVLSIDQKEAVGTFVSLSKDPLDSTSPKEVAPAKIRAWNGQQVTWILRNPSSREVRIKLAAVRRAGSPTDIKADVFSDLGGTVTIAKDCGISTINAMLQTNVVPPGDPGGHHPCPHQIFNYDFMMYVETDSSIVKFPYDPELVVEGKP